jgi:sulfite reductase (NADPH) hemoprotein beta-component
LYLGGGFAGQRLSKLYRADVPDHEIKQTLAPVFAEYARERKEGERFGDYCIRAGIVAETINGGDFHRNVRELEPAAVCY